MSRLENGLVAPAALFMGVTVLAVVGAAVYYFTRNDEPDVIANNGGGGSGTPDDATPDDAALGIIPGDKWNTTVSGTSVVNLQKGRTYSTTITFPKQLTDPDGYRFNVVGNIDVKSRTKPTLSNIPDAGATMTVEFVPNGSGSLQFVWPKNATPGADVLVQFRRLTIAASDTVA